MLSIKSFSTILALGVLSAMAAPTAEPASENAVLARAPLPKVQACIHSKWRDCFIFTVKVGECFKVPPSYNEKISSIRNLSRDRYSCAWYADEWCKEKGYPNQEDADLSDGSGYHNDRISSWRCSHKQPGLAKATA